MTRQILLGDFGKALARYVGDHSTHAAQEIATALISRYEGDEEDLERALGEVLQDVMAVARIARLWERGEIESIRVILERPKGGKKRG